MKGSEVCVSFFLAQGHYPRFELFLPLPCCPAAKNKVAPQVRISHSATFDQAISVHLLSAQLVKLGALQVDGRLRLRQLCR